MPQFTTKYLKYFLSVLVLFFIYQVPTMAQLVIKDKDGTTYRIREGIKINYRLKGDTAIHRATIRNFGEDSDDQTVYLYGGRYFLPSQLSYIEFKPKKIKRAIWVSGLGAIAITGIAAVCYDASSSSYPGKVSATLVYLVALPIAIPSLWIVSEITDLVCAKKKVIYNLNNDIEIRIE